VCRWHPENTRSQEVGGGARVWGAGPATCPSLVARRWMLDPPPARGSGDGRVWGREGEAPSRIPSPPQPQAAKRPVIPSQWSASERSRGLRREGREGLPDGARQRARWRSIVGRSRSPEATSRQDEGARPSPCSAAGAAAECVPTPTSRIPRSGSRQRWASRCSVSPSRGAIDLVIMATKTRVNTRREVRRLAR
jgi:hypothetical protein